MQKIRPKDEEYWKQFRGTPKAFVTLAAGRRMWGNRFGDLTAMRFAGGSREAIERGLLAKLDPAAIGLRFTPGSEEEALAGSAQSEDFGGLFLGFSFFLIASALILLGLLFQFGADAAGAARARPEHRPKPRRSAPGGPAPGRVSRSRPGSGGRADAAG